MSYSQHDLKTIFERTDGRRHLCGKQLVRGNHGAPQGTRGAWHVEHSNAKANGGTDHGRNLLPGCVACNLEKGAKLTTSALRERNGLAARPESKMERLVREGFWRTVGYGAIAALVLVCILALFWPGLFWAAVARVKQTLARVWRPSLRTAVPG